MIAEDTKKSIPKLVDAEELIQDELAAEAYADLEADQFHARAAGWPTLDGVVLWSTFDH